MELEVQFEASDQTLSVDFGEVNPLIRLNPVPKTDEMTSPVGVDENGKLFTTPYPYTYTLPTANESTLGGVRPVTQTNQMTVPVGVNSTGQLFAERTGGAVTLWSGTASPGDSIELSDYISRYNWLGIYFSDCVFYAAPVGNYISGGTVRSSNTAGVASMYFKSAALSVQAGSKVLTLLNAGQISIAPASTVHTYTEQSISKIIGYKL